MYKIKSKNESDLLELISIKESINNLNNKHDKRLSVNAVNFQNGTKIDFFKIRKFLILRGIFWYTIFLISTILTICLGLYLKPHNIFMPIASTILSLIITSITRQIALPLFENISWLEMLYGGKLLYVDIVTSNSIWSIQSLFVILRHFRMKGIYIIFILFLIMISLSYISPIWSLLFTLDTTTTKLSNSLLNWKTCDNFNNFNKSLNISDFSNSNKDIIIGILNDSFPNSAYGWGTSIINLTKIDIECNLINEVNTTCQFANKWGLKKNDGSCIPDMDATNVTILEKNNKIIIAMLENINYLNYDQHSSPNTFVSECTLNILTGISSANISSNNIIYSEISKLYINIEKTNLVKSIVSNINDTFFKNWLLFGISINKNNNQIEFIKKSFYNLIHTISTCENTNQIIDLVYHIQSVDVRLNIKAVVITIICTFSLDIFIIVIQCIYLPQSGVIRGRSILSTMACIDIDLCKLLQNGHCAEDINTLRNNINKDLKLYYGVKINEENKKYLTCTSEKLGKIENKEIYY